MSRLSIFQQLLEPIYLCIVDGATHLAALDLGAALFGVVGRQHEVDRHTQRGESAATFRVLQHSGFLNDLELEERLVVEESERVFEGRLEELDFGGLVLAACASVITHVYIGHIGMFNFSVLVLVLAVEIEGVIILTCG